MIHLTIKKLVFCLTLSSYILLSSYCATIPVHASTSLPTSTTDVILPTEQTLNWPSAPMISANSAILMELETGTILYGKNIHTKEFPASITKLLTTYIATNTTSLDDTITMSDEAVHSIDWRSDSNIGIKVGNAISMEEALYAVMVQSANEVAYAVGEHISGSVDEFAIRMTETATELGCLNSNFVNPNGIHDDNHYTTAYDMALIASAYFRNEFNCLLSNTAHYTIPASPTQPNDAMYLSSKNKLLPNHAYAYEYLVGSKTGYTDVANQTLVSCARKDGLTLVCVVLNVDQPYQFKDTVSLFQYGFSNFSAYPVLEHDTYYSIHNTDLFDTVSTDLGAAKSLLSFDDTSYIVLPNQASFQDATSYLAYLDSTEEDAIATVYYEYEDIPVGHASIYSTHIETSDSLQYFEQSATAPATSALIETLPNSNTIIVNVKYMLYVFIGIALLVMVLFIIKSRILSYSYTPTLPSFLKRQQRIHVSKKRHRSYKSKKPFLLTRIWRRFLSFFHHYYD